MPTYEYVCKDCKKRFELVHTVTEHEKKKPTCPKCKGKNVAQQYSHFFAKTASKS